MAQIPIDLPQFQLWLAQHGRRPNTIRKIANLYKLLLAKGVIFTPLTNIQQFIFDNLEVYSGGYLNNLIDCARVYAHYREAEGLSFDPSIYKLKHVKDNPKAKATMSDEEIESFINLPCDTFIAKRHGKEVEMKADPKGYAMWTMFWKICAFSGMRTGEVAHLKVDQVDFGRSVFVLSEDDTKTHSARYVPIAPNISSDLKEYIANLKGKDLFSKKGNGRVFGNADWHFSFHNRITRLGIKRYNLTPYSLRHSLITRLLEEDVNIFKVQKIVGHKDIKTTAGYTHLTTKDVIQAISKHPIIRKGIDSTEKIKAIDDMITSTLDGDKRFEVTKLISAEGIEVKVKII